MLGILLGTGDRDTNKAPALVELTVSINGVMMSMQQKHQHFHFYHILNTPNNKKGMLSNRKPATKGVPNKSE